MHCIGKNTCDVVGTFFRLFFSKIKNENITDVCPADNIDVSHLNQYPSVAAPAKFLTDAMVRKSPNVTPGFIHFWKYDADVYPCATFPGVR